MKAFISATEALIAEETAENGFEVETFFDFMLVLQVVVVVLGHFENRLKCHLNQCNTTDFVQIKFVTY